MDKQRLRINKKENFPDGYIESWNKSNNKSNEISSKKKSIKFIPVSIILSIQNNLLLTKENNYEIRFNTGMLEGKGISINDTGTMISFNNEGSYRFEFCGNGVIFSDAEVKLIYQSDSFSDDMKVFTETLICKDENKLQLRGISTILPVKQNQSIKIKIIPIPDEKILLNEGARLLIYRVA